MRISNPNRWSNWQSSAKSHEASRCGSRNRSNSFTCFSSTALFDRGEDVGDDFASWFRAEVAFAVDADADSTGFQVAAADDQHGVDFHLLGALDFAIDFVGGKIGLDSDFVRAEFGDDLLRVVEQRLLVADR